jgi:phage terminase large subunit-like protein
MAWSLACPDWEARLRDGRSLVPDLPLDKVQADRAVAVFNKLRLADVPGNPTLADAAGDWFRDIVRALFGSYDAATGLRHIRELFCLVPKKNAKTSYGGLLQLTALLLNQRPRAKFILAGPTQDVAELAFGQVKGAIELDDVLAAKLHVREHLKKIQHRQTGAELQIMTFDPTVLTGQKPAGILIDELHVCAKAAKAASAIRQLRGGMIATPEAFMAFITTQSEEAPVGAFRAELQQARAIRDGRRTGAMLPVLYEFPEHMQRDRSVWTNPANWPMVTPNVGRSITIQRLVEEYRSAEDKGEDDLRAWASQHLNVEIGLALQTDRWAGADHWEAAVDPSLTLDALLERSDVVVAGIDGGGLDDLLGLAILGRERDTRRWLLWNRAWAHAGVLDRRKSEASRLRDLESSGDLVISDDMAEANDELAQVVAQVHQAGLLAQVGLDLYGPADAVDALAQHGMAGDGLVVGIQQGWRLNGTIKTVENRLANGSMVHGGQALMAWCVGNAKVEPKGNAISITKQAAGTAKIDPLVATFCAGALMVRNPTIRAGASQVFV